MRMARIILTAVLAAQAISGFRARLDAESSAESVVASARAVPRRLVAVLSCRRLGHGFVAAVAPFARTARRNHRRRAHLDVVLESPVVRRPAGPRIERVGGQSGRRAAYRRTRILSERGGRRRGSRDYRRGMAGCASCRHWCSCAPSLAIEARHRTRSPLQIKEAAIRKCDGPEREAGTTVQIVFQEARESERQRCPRSTWTAQSVW